MKKRFLFFALVFALTLAMLSGCELLSSSKDENQDSGSDAANVESIFASFNDITLEENEDFRLAEEIKIGERSVKLTYTYEGNNISISNGVLVALVADTETVVKASAESFSGTFKVKVNAKAESEDEAEDEVTAPEINIIFSDITLELGKEIALVKSIKIDGVERALSYTFLGNNISVEGYTLKALKLNTTTSVKAQADGFESVFNVKVVGNVGTMTVDAPEYIYTNYAPKPITVTFSNPDYATDVTYTSSDSRVTVDDGKISAKGTFSAATDVTVTAKSEYHTQTFTVNVSAFNEHSAETKVQWYEVNIIKPENKGGTIFIGDSYFDGVLNANGEAQFWKDFYSDYTDNKTFLMGISSSQITHWEVVAERIVYPMEPKEIVLHIGFNDVHNTEKSAYEIATRIIAFLDEVSEKLPNTKIYYCSVEPKKNALDANTQYYQKSMIYAPMINTMLQAYTYQNKNVKFVNTREIFFKDDGTINKNLYLSTDLSHPTLEAYDLYRQLIEQARGNLFEELTPTEALEAIKANQSAVNNAAAVAKLSGTVYTINNNPKVDSAQNIAKYFTNNSGSALTNFYSVKGYMEISNLTTNAHVQFRFGGNTNNRFLIFDSNGNKKLGLCAPFDGRSSETSNGSIADALDASGGSVVLSWQVIVTEKTAYFFVNDVLVMYGEPGELLSFNVSVEWANISFWGVEATAKSDNESAYNEILKEKKITTV